MVVNIFPPLGLANAFYLPRFFATDLVPTGTRSFAKKTSVNKKHFPAPGGNIYSRPGPGNAFYLQSFFLAKDRVPVGTRSVAKKSEVNKKHLPGPRVGRYLPPWRASTAWFDYNYI